MDRIRLTPLTETFGLALDCEGGSLDDLDPIPLLQRHGALLFRGFEADIPTFKRFTEASCRDFSNYEGGVFRSGALNRESVGADPTLMTTTGHTQGFPISLHGEMHYLQTPPSVLWFYCQTPSAEAGQTTLCDGAALWEALLPETREFFTEHRVRYTRWLADGDWQTTSGTDDPEAARRACADLGMTMEPSAEDRSVTLHFTCRAVRAGRWFVNSVLPTLDAEWAFESGWIAENLGPSGARGRPPMVVRTESGGRLPEAVVKDLKAAAARLTVDIDWRSGDLAMVDNLRVMHGRREARDRNRSILVRMGELRVPAP